MLPLTIRRAPLADLRAPDATPGLIVDVDAHELIVDARAGVNPPSRDARRISFPILLGTDSPATLDDARLDAILDATTVFAGRLVASPGSLVLRAQIVQMIRVAFDRLTTGDGTVVVVDDAWRDARAAREKAAAVLIAQHAVALHDPTGHDGWTVQLDTLDGLVALGAHHPVHGDHSHLVTLWADGPGIVAGDVLAAYDALLVDAQAGTGVAA